jgi:hypothetical protein
MRLNNNMHADRYSDTTEMRLWQSVLQQAFADAVWPVCGYEKERAILTAQAREWLTKPSESFDLVCSICNLAPDKVRVVAARIIAEAIANPRTPKRGPGRGRPGGGSGLPTHEGDRLGCIARDTAELEFSKC